MAKITRYLRLERMSILQAFVLLNCVYLVVVLTAIVLQFEWAERLRQEFAGHPAGNEWVLTVQMIAILVTIGAGLLMMASLFYKLKLKKPLDLLMNASEKISNNDLGFHISYDSRDELGELCRAFEKMRVQLETNFKSLWRSAEERNQISAIFAHDLRTPIAVMKGYLEFIAAYLPQKRISEEKLLDTVQTMESHIRRMERYVESMSSIQKLDEWPISKQETELGAFRTRLDDSASRIALLSGKDFESCSDEVDSGQLFVDMDLVMQVFENMIANAARYASSQVKAEYAVTSGVLSITVSDDGPGFSPEEQQRAVLPFYRGDVSEASEHYGLGLYICKILCEKHQGVVKITNGPHGGGQVTASFFMRSR